MSSEASAWAMNQTTGSPLSKLTLLLMADSADMEHVCSFSAFATVVDRLEANPSGPAATIKALADRQLILPVKNGWRLAVDD